MKEIVSKEYNNFTEFNKEGCYLTEYIKNNTPEMNNAEQIKYARKVFSSSILNSFIVIGYISEEIKNLLNCSKCELKFSIDNMIKNRKENFIKSLHLLNADRYRKY